MRSTVILTTRGIVAVVGMALAALAAEPATAQELDAGQLAEDESDGLVPFGEDSDEPALEIDGRPWVTVPSDPHRCDAAHALLARVTEVAAHVRSIHLPRLPRTPLTEDSIEESWNLLDEWLNRMRRLGEEIGREVAAVHDEACAVPSVEALEAMASAHTHELREFDSHTDPPPSQSYGLTCRPDVMLALRLRAMSVDEACLTLAVNERAFVPAALRCSQRLVAAGRIEYALDELVPHGPWADGLVVLEPDRLSAGQP